LRSQELVAEAAAEPVAVSAKQGVSCGSKTCKPCEVCRNDPGREAWCFRPDSIECAQEYTNSLPLAVCSGVTCQKCETCKNEGGRDVCYLNPSLLCRK
jgi:hypothetical protein